MGLVNKDSIFDRIPNSNSAEDDKYIGENIEGTKFDLGNQSTLQQDSLISSRLDLDGKPDSMYNRQDSDPGFTIFPERGIPIASDSPFDSPTGDHMVDLLDKLKISSNNSGQIYRGTPAHGQGFDLNGRPGPQFDKGIESTLQQDSLLTSEIDLNGKDEGQGLFDKGFDSTIQEDLLVNEDSDLHYMDGLQPPLFDLGKDSTLQPDSLASIPGGSQNSPFQDLDGQDGGEGFFHKIDNPTKGQGFQIKGVDLHEHLLTKGYTYGHSGTSTTILPENERGNEGGKFDLNGVAGGEGFFHKIDRPTQGQGKQIGGVDLHEHLLTKSYTYNHAGMSTTILQRKDGKGGELDINGNVGGNGYFNGTGDGGALQGFQIKGVDLHKHMLENGYGTRSVHDGTNSFSFIKESRAAGRLDLDGGIPPYGSYSKNKPESGARL